jgi:hypothetical protein
MKKYASIFCVVLIAFFLICGYNNYAFLNYAFANTQISRAENAESAESVAIKPIKNAEYAINTAVNCAESAAVTVDGLKKIAFENPKVRRVEACVRGNAAVIAIRCDAVFFRSENLAICDEIRKKAERAGLSEVCVTKDTGIFFKIAEAEKTFAKNGNKTEYIKAKESIFKAVKGRI